MERVKGLISRLLKRKEAAQLEAPKELPELAEVIESYPLGKFVSASIVRGADGQIRYRLEYVPLEGEEAKVFERMKRVFREEAEFEVKGDMLEAFKAELLKRMRKYGWKLPEESVEKILYYAGRDLLKTGYGILDGFMRDPNIEDIRCNGVGIPVFVWHVRYKYLPTNVSFDDETQLDNFVRRLAQIAGKHISVAYPRVVALLPGNHRLSANYSREITRFGSAFQIRKFKEVAMSVVDLLDRGTVSPRMAAYFWILMENKVPMMVIGATGAGKTTMLNALLSMLKPGTGIITVEESPELNLHHKNWISKYARESYGIGGVGAIGMFELVEDALKQRPEVLVIGEVTGKEATVLFSAIATGHGGLCTFHAENVRSAVRRLIGRDIGVAPEDIELMRVYISVQQVEPRGTTDYSTRRVMEVVEVERYEAAKDRLVARTVFKWDPATDTFEERLEDSYILPKVAAALGRTKEEIMDEIDRRAAFLADLREKGVRSYEEVAQAITRYWEGRT